jgi:hypothetical protein
MRVPTVESFSLDLQESDKANNTQIGKLKPAKITPAHGVWWNSWVSNANH